MTKNCRITWNSQFFLLPSQDALQTIFDHRVVLHKDFAIVCIIPQSLNSLLCWLRQWLIVPYSCATHISGLLNSFFFFVLCLSVIPFLAFEDSCSSIFSILILFHSEFLQDGKMKSLFFQELPWHRLLFSLL